jgi:DNA-binding CsgD family transcriptional regulator
LHFHFSLTDRPDYWLPVIRAQGFDHQVVGTFEEDGVEHTVIANDWRRMNMGDWLLDSAEKGVERRLQREFAESKADLGALIGARLARLAAEVELTAREIQVLELLVIGRNTKEIGIALDISQRTAKFHQANVLRKIGADSRSDILRVLL